MTTTTSHAVVSLRDPDGEVRFHERQFSRADPMASDLLVRVEAIAVNPVDVKLSRRRETESIEGFDAVGTVLARGPDAQRAAVGDRVWYSGTPTREGSMQSLQVVDDRIAGRAPGNLSAEDAAALPLATLTAWESLFERLRLGTNARGTLLLVGGAGGVGSSVLALASTLLPGVQVIATTSRPESTRWALRLGARATVDHNGDLVAQVRDIVPGGVDWIVSTASSGRIADFAALLRPCGHIVGLEGTSAEVTALKPISASWHWEYVFTRAEPKDHGDAQGRILDQIAELVEAGRIRSTRTHTAGVLAPGTVATAYEQLESRRTIGKIVLTVS